MAYTQRKTIYIEVINPQSWNNCVFEVADYKYNKLFFRQISEREAILKAALLNSNGQIYKTDKDADLHLPVLMEVYEKNIRKIGV